MVSNIDGKVLLNNGVQMPGFGYGCYKAFGDELYRGLLCALECGYRCIDSAAFYENEREVGKALAAFPLKREELFVVSKIWPCSFAEPVKALDATLRDLRLDYLDGYLLHWPGLDERSRWRAFEILLGEVEKGKIRALGVSNFLKAQLETLYDKFSLWPCINQIEAHPLYQEPELCGFCMERGIQIVSWSPLGRGKGMELPAIREIAEDLRKTPAQIILRWQTQKNYVPIPKSVHPARIKENADIFNFSLSETQMRIIGELNLPDSAGKIGKDPLVFPEC